MSVPPGVVAAPAGSPGEIARLVCFGAVGVSNTAITFTAFALLAALGCPAPAASAIGFCLGAVNGFQLNRRWTFSDGAPGPTAGARYTAIQGLGAALSAAGVAALQSAGSPHLTAECVILPMVTVVVYSLSRLLVFRSAPS